MCDPAPGSSAECSAGIPECLGDGWRLDCDMEPPNPDGSEVCVIVDANGERPAVRQSPLCNGDEPTCSLVGSPVCVVYP